MKRNEKESLLAVLNDRYSRFTIPSESPVITFLNAHGERIDLQHKSRDDVTWQGPIALYTARSPRHNVTYVCPCCHFSLERQE